MPNTWKITISVGNLGLAFTILHDMILGIFPEPTLRQGFVCKSRQSFQENPIRERGEQDRDGEESKWEYINNVRQAKLQPDSSPGELQSINYTGPLVLLSAKDLGSPYSGTDQSCGERDKRQGRSGKEWQYKFPETSPSLALLVKQLQ